LSSGKGGEGDEQQVQHGLTGEEGAQLPGGEGVGVVSGHFKAVPVFN